jgi:hypothetical protein
VGGVGVTDAYMHRARRKKEATALVEHAGARMTDRSTRLREAGS